MNNRVVYTDHGEEKRRTEGVSTADVRSILEHGLVLRRYPEDEPFESYLVFGWIDDSARLGAYDRGRPIHVVVADDDKRGVTWLITVYWCVNRDSFIDARG